MESLIQADDIWLQTAVVLAGVAVSIYLEQNFRWAAKISGPVLALVLAMLLSNLKIMPMQSKVIEVIETRFVPMAIPLLLFRANLVEIVRTTRTMFVAVNLAAMGTVLGAFLAAWMFRGALDQLPQVAGIMTASYVGGAINFYAVKEFFDVSENLTGPLMVADNIVMAVMFIVLLGIAEMAFFRRHFPHPHSLQSDDGGGQLLAARFWSPKAISLLDIAKGLAIAATIGALSYTLSGEIKAILPASFLRELLGNMYVLLTLFSVVLATALPRQLEKINGSNELGMFLLYLFFFAIGLPADLVTVVKSVPLMFPFCLVMAVANVVFTLAAGKLLRLNLEELLLCSNATLGGPPTAAGMAISKGWSGLVLPALLAGLWGYIIGTVTGIFVTQSLLRV